jgi:PIN domain
MRTVTNSLNEMAISIFGSIEGMLTHSSIQRWNTGHRERGAYNVMTGGLDYKWLPMGLEGRQLQSKALEEYRRFLAIVSALLKEQPDQSLKTFDQSRQRITAIIEQNTHTAFRSPSEAAIIARTELQSQVGLLSSLYDASSGQTVYVPDTNALIFNPQLEDWRFQDSRNFVIALIPTVLQELDELKVLHRNEVVRDKAEKLITRIKGYRTRGSLTVGVVLVRNVSQIIAMAVEPDMASSLPWLDPQNKDDRILASTLEVMRQRPRSAVVIVTRDINLQNKAEFARIPSIEPPTIVVT